MNGRVMDDTAGQRSLSKKKKTRNASGSKWRQKGARVERRRDAAEKEQIYSRDGDLR